MLWKAPSGSFFPEQELSTALKQPQENQGNPELKIAIHSSKPALLYLYFQVIVKQQNPPRCQTTGYDFN